MGRGVWLSSVALIGVVSATWAVPNAAVPQAAAQAVAGSVTNRALLDKYCLSCHNERLKTGGMSLEKLDLARLDEHGDVWEKVIRKVNAGMMPPAGMPRPSSADAEALVSYLGTRLDRIVAAHPNPGPGRIHRMNRAEYANAIRDLLALDVDVEALLPPDDSIAGFDNNAAALGSSPALLERYLAAAMKIAPLAVGIYRGGPVESTYRAPGDLSQTRQVEGLPFGTRGGLLIRHNFPVDGEYVFKATLWRNNAGRVRGLEAEHQVEMLVDDQRVHLVTVGTKEQFEASFVDRLNTALTPEFDVGLQVRVPVKAGVHTVGVTFVAKTAALDPQKLQPLLSPADAVDTHGVPRIDAVMITGPFGPGSGADTESHKRIFTCEPKSAAEEALCARTILSTLARRAYRRPATPADIDVLVGFYDSARKEGGRFEEGIERALLRVLTSPDFVFRMEFDPATAASGTPYRITDLELASRLSYFLWSSIPDDALLQAAVRGRLHDPLVLDQQVRRMLSDPRAEALTDNFAGQWLYLRNLRNVAPIGDEYPDFDDDLRQGFKRETELLFDSINREDRSVLDLLTANYTFVNERLAQHYGIPNIYGSDFRRVPVTNDARRGLLGQGSILAVTSNANRTSPVRRGKWILENLLGTPPPAPPPNVPPLVDNKDRDKPLTMREQMEQHRANPVCATCHKLMDPLGLALENFDAVGAWRIKDAGVAIDATTQLADGTPVDGPVGLRTAILRHPDRFVQTMTEKLMIYALGRGLEYYDMPTVRRIVKDSALHNYRFSSLVLGIVKSTPFQMRMKTSGTDQNGPAAPRVALR